MGLPVAANKPEKKGKKFGVLNGKIEKKSSTKSIKQIAEVKDKFNKQKKKLPIPVKVEVASPIPSPSKKVKKAAAAAAGKTNSETKSNVGNVNANTPKLEKKDKFNKVKKAKNPSKVAEAVTNVGSNKESKKGNNKSKEPATAAVESVKKEKKVLTKEQADKVLARRKEKFVAWETAVDSILSKQGLPKDQKELVKKSKKYSKLPLWKKNYITWVKSDPQYKDQKHGALIKKVYKLLKGAERKAKRDKKKTQPKPQMPKTQAAINRCVKLAASTGPASPIKSKIKKEKTESKFAKQKKGGKNDKKQAKKLKKSN